LGKCGKCLRYQEIISNSKYSRVSRDKATKEYRQHLKLSNAERDQYHLRVAQAQGHPERYLSLIADGSSPVHS
jgi:hypothetical protein